MARVITVSGGKGGVGKTNLSINIALSLALHGSRVCLFDADLGLANINVLLGLYPDYDLEDVISAEKSVRDIMIRDYQGVDIIPGSSGVERLANLAEEDVARLIDAFAALDEYDYFLFDTAAGISKSVIAFCLAATEVVIVITTEPTSLTDAYALLKVLHANGYAGTAKIIVNQCKNTAVASRTYNKLREVAHKYLGAELAPLGIVVHDKKLVESVHKQQPLVTLYPQSNAAKCIQVITSRLIENEPDDFTALPIASFWTRVLEIARGPIKLPEKSAAAAPPEPASAQTAAADPAPAAGNVAAKPAAELAAASRETGTAAGFAESPLLGQLRQAPADAADGARAASVFDRLEVADLPTLPHILLKLIETCSSEDASMHDLAAIVEKDPSLCSKILRMVNSVYYSFSQTINNFNQALTLLGIDTIRSMAVSASVYQVFNGIKDGEHFKLKHFWWHSLMSAVLANLIAKQTGYTQPEEAFLSGLLHDIGKLVLLKNFPDQYAQLLEQEQSGAPTAGGAKPLPRLTHCETGAWLIKHWKLQPFVADAVLYHHEPVHRVVNALPLVKIVCVANRLCTDGSATREERLRFARDVLDLAAEDVEAIVTEAEQQVAHIAESLDIDIEHPDELDAAADREAQAYLTGQIRDLSLLQGTLQSFLQARDRAAIHKVAREGLQVLFDVQDALLFLYDEQQNLLVGHRPPAAAGEEMPEDLLIPCQDGKSMLVAALQQARVIESFTHASQYGLTIIDEQLIRLMGREGAVCFPMIVRGQFVGAVMVGVDKSRRAFLTSHMRLMTMFVGHAALAFDAERALQDKARRVLEERLAASSAIARKVAHEVNNPLSIIKNYLKILEMNLADHGMSGDEVKIIQDEIDRVAAIIDELSDFSRPKAAERESLDLNRLLRDLVALTEEPYRQQGVTLQFEPDETLPPVATSKNGLKQVMLNLIKNAAEALSGSGTIVVATRFRADAEAVEIVVRDDGPGLSELIKERLFEPYISTKGGEHAGLGLSVVYGIVKELKGTIACHSAPGQGTRFVMQFPLA